MKLLMQDKRPEVRAKYGKAFRWLERELNIADAPFSVKLRLDDKPPVVERVSFSTVRVGMEFGGVNREIQPGNVLEMFINEFRSNNCDCDSCSEMRKKDALETLVHEMVHVKQMVEGRLYTKGNLVRWNGKIMHLRELPEYENHPWEHEADRTAGKLYPRLKEYMAS